MGSLAAKETFATVGCRSVTPQEVAGKCKENGGGVPVKPKTCVHHEDVA